MIYQQNIKLKNSRLAEFFTSLCSFPILSFHSSYPITVFISVHPFYKRNKWLDYLTDKTNNRKNKKRKTKKRQSRVFLFFSFNFFFCEISCLICCKLIPPVIYVTSTGWIIREVNYGSVFSKASSVVSFEILRKTNQAIDNQITTACSLNQMKIAAQVIKTLLLLSTVRFKTTHVPTITLKSLDKSLFLFRKYIF